MSPQNRDDNPRKRDAGDQPRPQPRPRPRPRSESSADGRPRSEGGKPRKRPPARGERRPPARGERRPSSADRARKPVGKKRPAPRRRRRRTRTLLLALLGIVLLVLLAGGLAFASIMRDLPDPGADPKGRDQTSVIYDRNGEVLASLFAEQNRTDVPLDEMPQDLVDAVIATEDRRFFTHDGVDPIGIIRALWVSLTTDRLQGGSTITQQYVKNAFITPERTVRRKVMEAVLAYQVEDRFNKREILELYMNTIYFGHGAYGVEAASQAFFRKPVQELTLTESAVIAGVIRSPGRFSPYLNPEDAVNRRNTVLGLMRDQGLITEEEYTAAEATPIETAGLPDNDAKAPYFVEYIKAQLIDQFGSEVVFRGGISVQTTLDLRLQNAAEKAVLDNLEDPEGPSAALVAIDPKTGEILAMVGGRDFASKQFNVAAQGRRQPGSAFKTFVLAAALAEGVGTEETFESGPRAFTLPNGQTWDVTGASPGGPMRLRTATERSVNSIFSELILDVGTDKVVETAKAMGVTTEFEAVPAIALGGMDQGVSPLEMSSAYATLASGGTASNPFGLAEVTDSAGDVLFSAEPSLTVGALDPAVAYLTTDMLKGVLTRGTATAARMGRPAAGKTGTTQDYGDAWFVGYTPQLSTAVWVGHPEAARELKDSAGRNITGGSVPSRIWAQFMKAAHEPWPVQDFPRPEGLTQVTVCTLSGQRAGQWCPESFTSLYLAQGLPDPCPTHTGPTEVEIPDVIGMTKQEAIAAFNRLMLQFRITEKDVRGVPAGVVSSQNPVGRSSGTTATVVTIVVSDGGASDRPPRAVFNLPAEATVGQRLTFDAVGSTDNGAITSYQWEFGDGNKLSGARVEYAYTAPGTFSVTLWVTDDRNQTSSVTRRITIR